MVNNRDKERYNTFSDEGWPVSKGFGGPATGLRSSSTSSSCVCKSANTTHNGRRCGVNTYKSTVKLVQWSGVPRCRRLECTASISRVPPKKPRHRPINSNRWRWDTGADNGQQHITLTIPQTCSLLLELCSFGCSGHHSIMVSWPSLHSPRLKSSQTLSYRSLEAASLPL